MLLFTNDLFNYFLHKQLRMNVKNGLFRFYLTSGGGAVIACQS